MKEKLLILFYFILFIINFGSSSSSVGIHTYFWLGVCERYYCCLFGCFVSLCYLSLFSYIRDNIYAFYLAVIFPIVTISFPMNVGLGARFNNSRNFFFCKLLHFAIDLIHSILLFFSSLLPKHKYYYRFQFGFFVHPVRCHFCLFINIYMFLSVRCYCCHCCMASLFVQKWIG